MNLDAIVDRFAERTVAVAGDMVADIYIFGKPIRLSREAPVPIVRFDEQRTVPGSAANTVHNLLALGARALPFGAVGDDPEGRSLREVFAATGADVAGLIVTPGRLTTSKTRILAGDDHISKQQVVRIDKEGPTGLVPDEERRLLDVLAAALPRLDALIVSDYGYGAVTAAVRDLVLGPARTCPLVVDSHERLTEFQGATVVTPNQREAELLAGFEIRDERDLARAGRAILDRGAFECVLLTMGNAGMTLFERDGPATRLPIAGASDEVTDVTGAGDTVAAVFTLALVSGASRIEAAWLATLGAGIVVRKRGTATASPAEMHAAIRKYGGPVARALGASVA